MSVTVGDRARAALRRTGRAAGLAAGVVGVALLLAGCGGSSGGANTTSSASSGQAVKFAQCMRSHGLPDFPDPVNGRLELKPTKGSDLDPSSQAFESALRTCKSLEPAGFLSAPSAQRQALLLKVAACMRSHGVPGFPDPTFSGGRLQLVLPRGIDANSPQFRAAIQACRSLAFQGGGP